MTGTTIGKGFAGRDQAPPLQLEPRDPRQLGSHNTPGSIGMAQDPGRVFPGKRCRATLAMSAHRAEARDRARRRGARAAAVKGSVPGAEGGDVIVRAVGEDAGRRGPEWNSS